MNFRFTLLSVLAFSIVSTIGNEAGGFIPLNPVLVFLLMTIAWFAGGMFLNNIADKLLGPAK